LKYFNEALAVNPRNELVYNNLASMHVTLKQYEAAIENAKKAIEIYPGLGQAYISMGQAYAGLGMKERAREAYRKAVQVDPAQKAIVDKEAAQLGG